MRVGSKFLFVVSVDVCLRTCTGEERVVEGVDFIFRGIRVENLGFLFDSNAIVGEIFSFVKFWCFNLLIEDDVLWKVVNFICDN